MSDDQRPMGPWPAVVLFLGILVFLAYLVSILVK